MFPLVRKLYCESENDKYIYKIPILDLSSKYIPFLGHLVSTAEKKTQFDLVGWILWKETDCFSSYILMLLTSKLLLP